VPGWALADCLAAPGPARRRRAVPEEFPLVAVSADRAAGALASQAGLAAGSDSAKWLFSLRNKRQAGGVVAVYI